MIKVIKLDRSVQITKGSGISGQVVVESVSTAGAVGDAAPKVGTISARKISASQLGGQRFVNLNKRLRGGRSALSSTSD